MRLLDGTFLSVLLLLDNLDKRLSSFYALPPKGHLSSDWIYEVPDRFFKKADQKFEGFLPNPLINFQGRNS